MALRSSILVCLALMCLMMIAPVAEAELTRISNIILQDGENDIQSAVIDPNAQYAYFGAAWDPGKIVKVRLSDFSRVGAISLPGARWLQSAAIDPNGDFAYFTTYNTNPGEVVKVRLSNFTLASTLTLQTDEDLIEAAVIDPTGQFAYFGVNRNPGTIVRVRLSNFTRVDALTMPNWSESLTSAVMDPTGEFAYFGAYGCCPGSVVKIRLSNFTRVGAVSLAAGEWGLARAVIDPNGQYAYFATSTAPGIVIEIRLSDFTRVKALSLQSGEDSIQSAVIDPSGQFAYFGTDEVAAPNVGVVVKVRLSDLTRVESLNLVWGDTNLWSAVIDPTGLFAYFGTLGSPGMILKVRLGGGSTMTVSYSVQGGGSPSAPILNYVLAGLNKQLALTTTPTAVGVDTGSIWSVTNPLGDSTALDVWRTTQPVTGTASGSQTLLFTYVHQYAVTLVQGWNLVSLPVVPDNPTITTVLSSQIASGKVSIVWSYTGSPKTWKFFQPGKSSTLATMNDGAGYWVYMTKTDTLYVTGSVIPPAALPSTYQLNAGWNLIGFKPQPTIQNETVSQYLISISGKYDSNNVWVYDNAGGAWTRATSSTWIVPCQAMWILVTAPATLRP